MKIYIHQSKQSVSLEDRLIPELKAKSSPKPTSEHPHHINIQESPKRKVHLYVCDKALSYLRGLGS